MHPDDLLTPTSSRPGARAGLGALHAVRGRPTGRGRAVGTALHAVPVTDRTRSALCGARVGGDPLPWAPVPEPDAAPDFCAECASLADVRLAASA